MNDNIPAPSLINETRKITVNGRKYYSITANRCTTCVDEDKYMFVKQRHTGGDITLECPNCDYYITVHPSMIKNNLNK